ncbi:MAG TPA: phosphatase PAP2 family protein [Acidimicrobiia bacterium]|nr:phosphatase PAP2 family protein [Acidimicrobiia bacterium]
MTAGSAARRTWLVTGGVALIVVAVCTFIVRDGVVSSLERSVFHAINDLPGALEAPMVGVQYLGVAVVPIVLALIAAVMRKWRLAIAALLVYPLKIFVEKVVLKELVYRSRPGTSVPDAILRHAPPHGPSFPSGHAIIAFAVAGILAPYLSRGWRIAAYVVAVAVGVSRVYLGAHNPVDVVAGAAAGLLIAAGLNLLLAPEFGVLGRKASARTR